MPEDDRRNQWVLGERRSKFDYTLGYIVKFLELHDAPEDIRSSFDNIARSIIAADDKIKL